jgi:hypothetical protein
MHSPRLLSNTDTEKITKNDLVVEMVDGKPILGVKKDARDKFFARHIFVKRDMPKIPEDSDIEKYYYISAKTLETLIEHAIRQHQDKPDATPYNSENIFVCRDLDKLGAILGNLDLDPGVDAKFIYFSGIHAIPFYLRNDDGKINCFIADTLGPSIGNASILTVIKKKFPNAHIVRSNTLLQTDWYSCSTLAFKIIRYFAKHGAEIFPFLQSKKLSKGIVGGVKFDYLNPGDLMPALLKLCQQNVLPLEEKKADAQVVLYIDAKALETKVSKQKDQTLSVYLKEGQIQVDTLKRNATAILKRYKYLEQADRYLLQEYLKKNKLSLPKWFYSIADFETELIPELLKQNSNPQQILDMIKMFYDFDFHLLHRLVERPGLAAIQFYSY